MYRFDLGTVPPQANGIKVYTPEDASEELIMEIDFLWAGQQDIELAVQPIPQKIPVVAFASRTISDLVNLTVRGPM